MQFQLGDRVVYTSDTSSYLMVPLGPEPGMTGTIVVFKDNWELIGVRFDPAFQRGHSLSDRISAGCGWWCGEGDLKLIEPEEELTINDLDLLEVL